MNSIFLRCAPRNGIMILFVAVCLAMTGCAGKQLTRTEFLALNEATSKAMVREYPGIGKDRVLVACENALKASDSKYAVSQHMPNGFYAKRSWLIYMVLAAAGGENHWKITVEDKDGVSRVEARSWAGQGMSAGPFPVPFPGKSENEYYTSPSLYKLFFDRVDYFLGLRSDWATCDAAEKNMHQYEAGVGTGLEALCSIVREKNPTAIDSD